MKKIFIIVPLLVGLLFFTSVQPSFASKTTKTLNLNLSWTYSDYAGSESFTFYKGSNTTLIRSVVISYNISNYSTGTCRIRAIGLEVEQGEKKSATKAVVSSFYPETNNVDIYKSPYANASATLYSVTVEEYSLDDTRVGLTENGYVEFTITQNAPDKGLDYKIKNNTTGKSLPTVSNPSTKTFKITDISPQLGIINNYTLTWATGATLDFAIYVPLDPSLYNAVVNDNGNTIDAVRDKDGTVLQAARSAKTAADSAKSSADAAKSEATSAKNQTQYSGKYGGTSESVADVAGYIRNQQLPDLTNKIANLENTVNNINNNIVSDSIAPIVKVQTVSGARATSAGSIEAIISASDNQSGTLQYRANRGSWDNLPSNGKVWLPVTQAGMNTITVEVRDPAGNIGRDTITIRKL